MIQMKMDLWRTSLPLNDITAITPVSGGDVNDAYKVETLEETYFLLIQPNRSEQFMQQKLQDSKHLKKQVLLHHVSLLLEK